MLLEVEQLVAQKPAWLADDLLKLFEPSLAPSSEATTSLATCHRLSPGDLPSPSERRLIQAMMRMLQPRRPLVVKIRERPPLEFPRCRLITRLVAVARRLFCRAQQVAKNSLLKVAAQPARFDACDAPPPIRRGRVARRGSEFCPFCPESANSRCGHLG